MAMTTLLAHDLPQDSGWPGFFEGNPPLDFDKSIPPAHISRDRRLPEQPPPDPERIILKQRHFTWM